MATRTEKATLRLLSILKGPNLKRNFLLAFSALFAFFLCVFFGFHYLDRVMLRSDFFTHPTRLVSGDKLDVFLAKGEDINALDDKGENCLFNLGIPTSTGLDEFDDYYFRYFIQRGAKINLLNPEGENVLTKFILHTNLEREYLSSNRRYFEIAENNLRVLNNLGFDINIISKNGASARDKIKNIPELSYIFHR
ncbi:MAG: hypothetical protein A2X86_09355 [Bdellovibrionales bacterium GWA2_49_15]|nr:MAG: hypothetical protein A2X86_09355 [Bdellovibrionales bacterium GWA2_49_15]HAZ12986.1 hypothetical protein [Bdellovibrionales bacterium]